MVLSVLNNYKLITAVNIMIDGNPNEVSTTNVREELMNEVDDLLPEGYEIYELEFDDSVYVSKEGFGDNATAEIRYAAAREVGTDIEENSANFLLSVSIAGPDSDNVTTWFSLESCVNSAVKQLERQVN